VGPYHVAGWYRPREGVQPPHFQGPAYKLVWFSVGLGLGVWKTGPES
jgi:hypothetical protein